jgi:hypothetical protein
MKLILSSTLAAAAALLCSAALAGIVDPDCTAEKAAKGVGGRCDAKEAAKDSSKKAVGVEDKGPIEKKKAKNDGPAEKAKNTAKKATD